MSKILERSKITLKTGKWYANQWWQEDKYYQNGVASKEEVEIAFNELIRVFDDKWIIEQNFSHPFCTRLIEGLLPFQFLYQLGLNLHTVKREALIGDLERRLKNPKEYWEAAAFELKFLSKFLQQRFNIERNYKSGKGKTGKCNCDFKISTRGNEIVFVEIKRLKTFHLQNEETIENGNRSLWNQLLRDNSEVKTDFSRPLSHKIEINKIFRHISDATKNQLPGKGPGIVIVEVPFIELEQVKYALKNRLWNRGENSHQKYAHLSAIVLAKVFFDANKGSIRNNISIILNPKAEIDVSSYAAKEVINSLTDT